MGAAVIATTSRQRTGVKSGVTWKEISPLGGTLLQKENFGSCWLRHIHKIWKMQVKEPLPEGSDTLWEGQRFEKETWLTGLVLPLACTGSSWQGYMNVQVIFPISQMERTIHHLCKVH